MSQKRPPTSTEPGPASKKARGSTIIPTPTDPTSSTSSTPIKKARKGPHINPLAKKYGHHARKQVSGAKDGGDGEDGSGAAGESLAKLRKSLRDAQRILRRPTIPATLQVDLERRIKAIMLKIAERERKDKEDALWVKYKYLRFVEQKKIQRRLNTLRTTLDSTPASEPAHEKISAAIHVQTVNLAYAKRFPRDMKYIALFPKDSDDSSVGNDKPPSDDTRRRIWNAVERCVLRGDADGFVLREKDLDGGVRAGSTEAESDEDGPLQPEGGDDFFLAGDDDDEEDTKPNTEQGDDDQAEGREEEIEQPVVENRAQRRKRLREEGVKA
ncbi:hypothetical protein DFJ77DRAFT_436923 [Powellomyces hirtus]|nr:hypothetical protein DFJ77DRAFT_436923 [Powellomyces hirtus]